MNHSFNVEFAKQYGIEEAILIENLYFWCSKNYSNEKHIYDGNVWSYNSVSAFNGLFPYMTEYKIIRALKNLEKNKLIMSGNYSENPYNRTKWYSVTEKAISILQYQQFDLLKTTNGKVENHKCTNSENHKSIYSTDINPFDKPFIKPHTSEIETIYNQFQGICTSLPKPKKLTDSRKKVIKARLKEYSKDEIIEVFKKVQDSDFLSGRNKQWQASFDWILKPANFVKILEDNYKNKPKQFNMPTNKDYSAQITEEEIRMYNE